MNERDLYKAAVCGEPSYVWRAGQDRRLRMIELAAGDRIRKAILENGCGVGMYVEKLAGFGGRVIGLEFDLVRAADARQRAGEVVNAAGESLPFPNGTFDLILSHEVIEHVRDDRAAVREMLRVLRPGGRAVIFCPNRGYPFETHGIYWKGRYSFGNKLFVNYLPRRMRDRLAPHVRVYSARDVQGLFDGVKGKIIERRIIFGAYDNLIARFGLLGKSLRAVLQFLESTPLSVLGLSHFWVVEKVSD
ncbi:MAG: class I SAM-dependent methyltransferase [Chloroflexi bacterium]|nr:class I SAM-dependent methyltransferase [Chloroflexota bacterium]